MDITIYLPEELGKRAKDDASVNLSRMLRDALTEHYHQEDAMEATLKDPTTIELDLENGTIGRFTGKEIGENVFLTESGNVVGYDPDKLEYSVLEDPQNQLQDLLPDPEEYAHAMNALGLRPVIDLPV
jgi:hypothetical protein